MRAFLQISTATDVNDVSQKVKGVTRNEISVQLKQRFHSLTVINSASVWCNTNSLKKAEWQWRVLIWGTHMHRSWSIYSLGWFKVCKTNLQHSLLDYKPLVLNKICVLNIKLSFVEFGHCFIDTLHMEIFYFLLLRLLLNTILQNKQSTTFNQKSTQIESQWVFS